MELKQYSYLAYPFVSKMMYNLMNLLDSTQRYAYLNKQLWKLAISCLSKRELISPLLHIRLRLKKQFITALDEQFVSFKDNSCTFWGKHQ